MALSSSLPCKDCFSGDLTAEVPSGVEMVVHGLNTYVAFPPSTTDGLTPTVPKGVVVMIPDAFGWKMPNNRVLCDVYARKGGHLVLLPDFMAGQNIPPSHLNLMADITTPSSWSHTLLQKPFLVAKALYTTLPPMYSFRSAITKPRILSFFQALKKETLSDDTSTSTTKAIGVEVNGLKIGVAGFCWGGQYAILLSQGDDSNHEEGGKGLIDCAFTAHPSFISIPGEIEKVKLPLSVCIGDTDLGVSAKNVQILKGVLDGKGGEEKGFECVVLKDAKHGFALRSCVLDDLQRGYAKVAEEQALAWFGRWLA